MADKRQDAATTTVGAGLVGVGGAATHEGVEQAMRASGRKKYPKVHGTMFRTERAGRRLWLAGNGAKLVGATGMAVGLHGLANRRSSVDKADSFLRQGLQGNQEAFKERVENMRQPKSPLAVGTAAGVAAGAGAGGSYAVRRLMKPGHGRAAASALGGSLAAIGSAGIANRVTSRVAPGYEVTATGVRRKKTAPVRPTRSARVVESRPGRGDPRAARRQIVPSDVNKLSDNSRRAALEGAYAAPVVGPVAGPLAAARMAPPGQKVEQASLTAGGRGAGMVAGSAAGAFGAAALARRNNGDNAVNRASQRTLETTSNLRTKIADRVGGRVGAAIKPKPGAMTTKINNMAGHANPVVRSAGRAMAHAAKPLKAVPAAAAVGGYLGSRAGSTVGGQGAYSMALRNEHKKAEQLSKGRRIAKSGTLAPALTSREQAAQYRRKRRGFALGTATAATGATGTALFGASLALKGKPVAARLERHALHTGLVGGGLGAAAAANTFGVQRRNLRQEKHDLQQSRVLDRDGVKKGLRRSALRMVPTATPGVVKPVRVKNTVTKIDTTMSNRQARQMTNQYGLKGPLPKELKDRNQRMKAYEARYISAGGPKGEKHQTKANRYDKLTGGLIATGGAAAFTEYGAEKLKHRNPRTAGRIVGRARNTALLAGGGAAASELMHRHHQNKARSYAGSPAGVAASALRRMRAYTPDTD